MIRLLPLLALAGCGWSGMPDGSDWDTEPLWSPTGVVAASGTLYVPLADGALAYVDTDGADSIVDLQGGQRRNLMVLPDETGIATFLDREYCVPDGRDECADLRTDSTVALIQDGELQLEVPVGKHLDTLAFAPGETRAVAWLAGPPPEGPLGVVNLNEIDILDLVDGTRTPVRVGFAADRILFTEDGVSAVVLSQSQVAVVDLTASPPRTSTTFPLTLDPDVVVTPVGVDLTPDGRFALISTNSGGDLYILDLLDPSVNLVSLPGTPSAMHVEPSTDETLFVFPSRSELTVMDHDRFELRTIDLDEPMSRILSTDRYALLYAENRGRDVYRYEYATGELTEYRLQAIPNEMALSPDGAFGVAFTAPTSTNRAGMELIDLRGVRGETIPYALDAPGVGLSFTTGDDGSVWALVLQDGIDSLWRGELATGIADVVPLIDAPVGIGDLGDGRFFIAHDNAMGLVSLYDPSDDTFLEASGFALQNILNETEPLTLEESP